MVPDLSSKLPSVAGYLIHKGCALGAGAASCLRVWLASSLAMDDEDVEDGEEGCDGVGVDGGDEGGDAGGDEDESRGVSERSCREVCSNLDNLFAFLISRVVLLISSVDSNFPVGLFLVCWTIHSKRTSDKEI